jgi:hypothetical protein
METVIVKPIRQRGEILFVFISMLLILACAGLLILARSKAVPDQKLKAYQISAFSALSTVAQGIFMDLYTGGFDIEMYHRQNGETWPDIPTLEANLIPPFEKSVVWEQRGRIRWTLSVMDKATIHRAAYFGETSDTAVCGSFILYLEHYHTADGAYFSGINKKTPFNIWYKSGVLPTAPRDFSEGALIASGWHEAIPYRGTDELAKLKRAH